MGGNVKEALIYIYSSYIEIYAYEFAELKWRYKRLAKSCRYVDYVNICDKDVIDDLLYYLLLHRYDVTICDFNGNKMCRRLRCVEDGGGENNQIHK